MSSHSPPPLPMAKHPPKDKGAGLRMALRQQLDYSCSRGGDVLILSHLLWHCLQGASEALGEEAIGADFGQRMDCDADAEQYGFGARQGDEGLVLDAEPNACEGHGGVQTRQFPVRMLIKFRRAAQAPVGAEPGGAGTKLRQEPVDLIADGGI